MRVRAIGESACSISLIPELVNRWPSCSILFELATAEKQSSFRCAAVDSMRGVSWFTIWVAKLRGHLAPSHSTRRSGYEIDAVEWVYREMSPLRDASGR